MSRSGYAQRGISLPVVLVSGITAAFFVLVCLLVIHWLRAAWSPSVANAERLLRKRKYSEALAVIERAGPDQQDNAALVVEKGKIYLLLAWERQNREHWANYGKDDSDWFKSTEASTAERLLKRAIELQPANIDAHYLLGSLYLKKGWFSSAETEFLAILQSKRKHVEARLALGVLYSRNGRYDLAEKELKHAYALAPDNMDVAKNLAFLYRFHLDQPDSAIAWSNRYLNLEPLRDRDINIVRSELVDMLKRYPELLPEEPMTWKKPPMFQSGR